MKNEIKLQQAIAFDQNVSGDFGIEIEVEGEVHDIGATWPQVAGWANVKDNSLHGFSTEYVTKGAVKAQYVRKFVGNVRKAIKATKGVEHIPSVRTGVHIHINMRDKTSLEIARFLSLFWILEPVFLAYCGEKRKGNLFCLSLQDAEYVINPASKFLQEFNPTWLKGNHLRYSLMNLHSLINHGSLEFRGLPTTEGMDNIDTVCKAFTRLSKVSKDMSIYSILEAFSMETPKEFAKNILGDFYTNVEDKVLEDDLHTNMRIVQPFIYSINEGVK